MKSLVRTLSLLPLLLAAFAIQASDHGGHDAPAASIMAHNGWVRAVPPASRMSAAYLQLMNHGTMADRLVGASSPIANVCEIHNVSSKDGMMQMFKVDGVEIPANGSVELKPGSYHIMLIGLKQTPAEGENVEVTLQFEHAGSMSITLPVKAGAMKPMDHGHAHH